MSGARTRRQAALATKAANTDSQVVVENGSSEAYSVAAKDTSEDADDDYPHENIFLFVPNLIGFSRIVLAIASLYFMPLHPRTCSILYSVSCLLDALDGYFARLLEQSTKFGAVLDMITDRATTSCLLCFLASAFPRWSIVFQLLISLDMASHYTHMYATLSLGGQNQSHKNVDKTRSWILNLYYTNRTVLFWFCALNEVFFIALYLLSFSSPLLSPGLLHQVSDSAASAIIKGGEVNPSVVGQIYASPYSAGALELARANKMDSTVPWIIASISFPIMLLKQFINVVQLIKASRWLAEGDIKTRREQGLPRRKKSA